MIILKRHSLFVFALCAFPGCSAQAPMPAPSQTSAPVAVVDKAVPPPIRALPPQVLSPEDDTPNETNAVIALPARDLPVVVESPSRIVYADSFSDMPGSEIWMINSSVNIRGKMRTRRLSIFAEPNPTGDFELSLIEDATTLGADDKPGVLSMSWAKVPEKLSYCGFKYQGFDGVGPELTLPAVARAKKKEDLKGIVVRCKVKGVNTVSEGKPEFVFDFRMETKGTLDYEYRCDLGRYTVTDDWVLLQAEMSECQNTEKFIKSIVDEKATAFKLVWSQVGDVSSYHSGDTLLVDDIEIVVPLDQVSPPAE